MDATDADGVGEAPTLTILSWNVLAQCYVDVHPPPHLLSAGPWKCAHRRAQTERVLRDARAMVVCLQEQDHVDDYWAGVWGRLRYMSRYSQRPSKREGLAMLWRRSLELVAFECVQLDEAARDVGLADPTGTMCRGNIAQIAWFRWTEQKRDVLVVNCHLYWNPAVAHVKVVQFWAVCVRVHLFCTVHGIDVDRVPIVFCGDLNSLPDSGVVALALGGALPETHPEMRSFLRKAFPEVADVRIPWAWRSAFPEPNHFTNYTPTFRGIIDYVLYRNMADVALAQVLGTADGQHYTYDASEDFATLSSDGVSADIAYPRPRFSPLPSREWPSDHLALLVQLHLTK